MELKQFLGFHLGNMIKCFNLTHFDVEIKREDTPSFMEIDVDTTYLTGEIVYGNLIEDKYKAGDTDFVLKTLCHEVAHLFTSQITSLHKETKHSLKVEEQVTKHLSRLLYKHYKQYVKEVYRV